MNVKQKHGSEPEIKLSKSETMNLLQTAVILGQIRAALSGNLDDDWTRAITQIMIANKYYGWKEKEQP